MYKRGDLKQYSPGYYLEESNGNMGVFHIGGRKEVSLLILDLQAILKQIEEKTK